MNRGKQSGVAGSVSRGMHVGEYKKPKPLMKLLVLAVVMVVLVCGLAGGIYWLHYVRQKHTEAQNEILQQSLQTELSNANSYAYYQVMLQASTRLINGAATGKFELTKPELAQYHMDKAAALMNQRQYVQAASEAQYAANMVSGYRQATLELELEARYDEGERQQLIPILQHLTQLEQKSGDPMRGAIIAGYQEDISSLQQNQEIKIE